MRAFLTSFVVCALALLSLYVVVDSFTNLSNIADSVAKANQAAAGGTGAHAALGHFGATFASTVKNVLKMNASRMPLILYELLPVLTLAAAMFTVVKLKRANEITPLLAAGVSIYRVIWPIFLMAILLTLAQIVDREVLIPRYSDNLYAWDRIRNENLYQFRAKAMMEDGYGNVVFSARYDTAKRVQLGAQITRYWTEGTTKVPRVIVNAKTAEWESGPVPGWRYRDGWVIEYDSLGNFIGQTPCGPAGLFVPHMSAPQPPADYDDCHRCHPDAPRDQGGGHLLPADVLPPASMRTITACARTSRSTSTSASQRRLGT